MRSHPSGRWREIKMETYSSALPRALTHSHPLWALNPLHSDTDSPMQGRGERGLAEPAVCYWNAAGARSKSRGPKSPQCQVTQGENTKRARALDWVSTAGVRGGVAGRFIKLIQHSADYNPRERSVDIYSILTCLLFDRKDVGDLGGQKGDFCRLWDTKCSKCSWKPFRWFSNISKKFFTY